MIKIVKQIGFINNYALPLSRFNKVDFKLHGRVGEREDTASVPGVWVKNVFCGEVLLQTSMKNISINCA